MLKKVIISISLLFMLNSLFAEENLKSEWLDKDITLINQIFDFIEKGDYSNIEILDFINSREKKFNSEAVKLGFDLKEYNRNFAGGYISIGFSYYHYKTLPCELKISVYKYDFNRIQNHLPKELLEKFKSKFQESKYYYTYSIKNDVNLKKYKSAKEKLTGKIQPVTIPSEYEKYYELLNSYHGEKVYGELGGLGVSVPEGRIAMNKLLELKDKNVFINLMKGDNPAGRIYAAEGLLRLEKTQKNVDIINSIFKSLVKEKIEYECGEGCIHFFEQYKKFELSEDFPPEQKHYEYMMNNYGSEIDPFEIDLSFLE